MLDVARVSPPPASIAVAFAPLSAPRLAEPFEQLRDASDRMLAQTGARPRIFLANLGQLSEFTARATFAKNFFEAGGIEAVGNDGFAGRDEMVAAFKASGAKLACLCSSDEVYAREAAEAASALTAAGATDLSRRPARRAGSTAEAAGVISFIYVGCNTLETLRAAYQVRSK